MNDKDVADLPNVQGLEAFLSEDKGPAETQPVEQQPEQLVQATPPDKEGGEIDLEQFKSPREMLKSYKEIQGFVTRIAQENKTLKEQVDQMKEMQELARYQTAPPHVPPQPQATQGPDFDQMFIQNPQQAVASVAAQVAQQQFMKQQIVEVLNSKYAENPETYPERFAYAQQFSTQYPQLSLSREGVNKLFEMAEKTIKTNTQKRAREAIREIFGDDIDFDKMKALLGKPNAPSQINNAYMPDTSISSRTRTGPDTTKKVGIDAEIDAAVAKGDVDNVIANVFKKALAT